MKTKVILGTLTLVCLALGLTSCTSLQQMFKSKPTTDISTRHKLGAEPARQQALKNIKSAAIISLYGNNKIQHSDQRVVVKEWPRAFRSQVAKHALDVYTEQLQSLGWNMVAADRVLSSQEYKKAYQLSLNTFAKVHAAKNPKSRQNPGKLYFSPQKMLPISVADKLNRQALGGGVTAPLAQVTQQLAVDALVLVHLEYCYDGKITQILDYNESYLTAAAALTVINPHGDILFDMPEPQACGGPGQARSKSVVPLYSGILIYSQTAQKSIWGMVQEVHQESASLSTKALSQFMPKVKQGHNLSSP